MPTKCIGISRAGFSRSTPVYRRKEAHSRWVAKTYFIISSLISASNSNYESDGFSLDISLYSFIFSTSLIFSF